MKKQKISMLALAVLAGGITAASAASAKTVIAATYNAKVTVVPMVFVEPNGVPRSLIITGLVAQAGQSIVSMDGSGKIEGTSLLKLGDAGKVGSVRYLTSVTGSIKGKDNSVPTVDITLKGNGYSALTTNLGQIYEAIGTPATLSLKFKSTGVLTSSNLSGTLSGNIKTGIPAVDSLTSNGKLKNSLAVLDIVSHSVTNIDHTVVQAGNKLYLQSFTLGEFTGSGSVNNSRKANVSLKGIASSKGSSYKLSGTSASIPVITPGEPPVTNTVTFFSTTDVSGKAYGQQFKRSGGVVSTSPTLVPVPED